MNAARSRGFRRRIILSRKRRPCLRLSCVVLLLSTLLPAAHSETGLSDVVRRKHECLMRWADQWRDSGYPMQPDPREWKWDEYDPTWYGALAAVKLKRSRLEIEKANDYLSGMTEGGTMRAAEAIHTLYLFRDDPDLSEAARLRLRHLTIDTPAAKRIYESVWRYGTTENIAIMGHAWYLLAAQLKEDGDGQAQMEEHLSEFIDAHFQKGWIEFYSPCYMEKVTGALIMLTEWAESPRVRRKARALLDLMLAEYAVNSFDQVMAAPCTRAYGYNPIPADQELGHNEHRDFSCSGIYSMGYVLFGSGRMVDYGVLGTPALATCDYVPPKIVLDLAAAERGTFEFKAAKPALNVSRFGLAPNVPEPRDTARVYCWHTAEFVLAATQEVNYVHSALRYNPVNSILFFRGDPRKLIYTELTLEHGRENFVISVDVVQHKGIQIGKGAAGTAYFAKDLFEEVVEENGWIFVRDGGTFAAYRVVEGGYTWRHCEYPSVYGDYIDFSRRDSPFILHVSPSGAYDGDFAAFRRDVRENRIVNTRSGIRYVVTGKESFSLELRPGRPATTVPVGGDYSVCRGQTPKLNGREIDLDAYLAIDCPFLSQARNSRYAEIRLGRQRLTIGVGP